MGGSQLLVDHGKNVAPDYTAGSDYILNYNPRTSVGISKGCSDTDNTTNCRMFLITIDGRQASTNWSKGVRLPFLAGEQIRAGAWMALNFDGGGSTTMWVKKRDPAYCESSPGVGGCLAQRPSPSTGSGRPAPRSSSCRRLTPARPRDSGSDRDQVTRTHTSPSAPARAT